MTRRIVRLAGFLAMSGLVGLALAGCSSRRMHHGSLDSWVGVPVTAYVRANGQPSGRRVLPNGDTIYTFERSRIVHKPRYGESHGERGYGPAREPEPALYRDTALDMSCVTWLETDREGDITGWRQMGNGCY